MNLFSVPKVERKLQQLEAAQKLSKAGGHGRAAALSPKRRSEIASKAAKTRWKETCKQ